VQAEVPGADTEAGAQDKALTWASGLMVMAAV